MRYLSFSEVRKFYDAWGLKQDNPGPYESLALDEMMAVGNWAAAKNIAELGPGTGKFAHALMAGPVSPSARYSGFDLSETMLQICQHRLHTFSDRVHWCQTNGELPMWEAEVYDRVIANFVLDIFSPEMIAEFIDRSYVALEPKGLLCLANLSFGKKWANKVSISLWRLVYLIKPAIVGGCRPLKMAPYLDAQKWKILHEKITEPKRGIPSEVLIAQKI